MRRDNEKHTEGREVQKQKYEKVVKTMDRVIKGIEIKREIDGMRAHHEKLLIKRQR